MAQLLATRLHLKHLRLVAAIAQHRQLSVAAQILAMTQPAASRTLAEAEALVGVPLFERHAKGMIPTYAGEGLARRARNILDELNDASDEVERLRLGQGGVVRIGAVTGGAVGYVVPAIRALKERAPGAEVHVEVATSEELIAGLMSLRHDMVLGRVPPRSPPEGLSLQRAKGERVQIVAHRRHACANRKGLRLSELADAEWVMQGPGAPIRRAIEEAFLEQGAPPPRNVINTASLLMAHALLSSPNVVTPVSQEVAQLLTAESRELIILPVTDTITVTPYSLVTLRDRRLSPVAAQCRDLLSALVAAG
ncbi:MAG: LysR family transcriptional regulator [Cereibacter sphaeroides]|uniref:LysR family transcriptional regulator n=1 Tax=Cereibacter sphaeroides TaxID=1063 RepID=A0A2W5SEE1_CERSP|nr:MAG: LysR family transcriptional regulator [Cereibacter sphaeroides]